MRKQYLLIGGNKLCSQYCIHIILFFLTKYALVVIDGQKSLTPFCIIIFHLIDATGDAFLHAKQVFVCHPCLGFIELFMFTFEWQTTLKSLHRKACILHVITTNCEIHRVTSSGSQRLDPPVDGFEGILLQPRQSIQSTYCPSKHQGWGWNFYGSYPSLT